MQTEIMHTNIRSLPPIWLIVMMVIFPLVSENVYTPSLAQISTDLRASAADTELSLAIYLAGFAVGTMIWGVLSDKIGRKISLLSGILMYIIGSILCGCSNNITQLLVYRAIQSIGASAAGVMAQTISRDSFKGPELGRVFAIIGSFIFLAPAIGPSIGAVILKYFTWRYLFIFLALMGSAMFIICMITLPETKGESENQSLSIFGALCKKMFTDSKFLKMLALISIAQGSFFSYYSEAPFFFIKSLGLSQEAFGSSFILLSIGTVLGGITTSKMRKYVAAESMIYAAVKTAFASNILFLLIVLIHSYVWAMPFTLLISSIFATRFISYFSGTMIMSNAMAKVLEDYQSSIGSASSVFGFVNYFVISILTWNMSKIHNSTLLPLPIYLVFLNVFMLFFSYIIKKMSQRQKHSH